MRAALLLLLGAAAGSVCTAESVPAQDRLLFVYMGRALQVESDAMGLTLLGRLSPAAPTVARDPRGLIWGRVDPNFLAALDPASGRIVARVPLRHKVYNHVIAANGKAYVTHNALTKEGFSLSVVDTEQRVLCDEIGGIWGLRTDLIAAGGFVYLAALGVRREDYLHLYLYRIDTTTDRLEEILRYPRTGYSWRLSAHGRSLFVCYLPARGSGLPEKIEVLDLDTLRVVRTLDGSFWGEGRRLLGVYHGAGETFVLCSDAEGNGLLLQTDAELTGVRGCLRLGTPLYRVLGVEKTNLVYLDRPLGAGKAGRSLRFYDMRGRKEVKKIDLSGFLAAGGG